MTNNENLELLEGYFNRAIIGINLYKLDFKIWKNYYDIVQILIVSEKISKKPKNTNELISALINASVILIDDEEQTEYKKYIGVLSSLSIILNTPKINYFKETTLENINTEIQLFNMDNVDITNRQKR